VDLSYEKELFARMCLMRSFEQHVAEAVRTGEIHGEMHLAMGQESAGAVLQSHLRPGDAVVSTHRAHLHALAAGVDPVLLAAELLERDGLNGGKGGHMHLFASRNRFMCTGIVGASAPLALGYALAQRESATDITVAVAGDAAINHGSVMESLNLASVLPLPVLFLVEDNAYGISVPKSASTAGEVHRRAEPMGIPSWRVDGRDVRSVHEGFEQSVRHVRTTRSPALLAVDVYRFRGHYEGDADLYRSQEEKDAAMHETNDPLARTRSRLRGAGVSEHDLLGAERAAQEQTAQWFRDARAIAMPRLAEATRGVYVDD